jgi:hypothetical protein
MADAIQTLAKSSQKALDDFMALQLTKCLEVWLTLQPPQFGELNGEYRGDFLPNYNDVHKQHVSVTLRDVNGPRGYWIGKAFLPLGQVTGEGYNIWRMSDGRVVRNVRYGTHVGTSRIDGRLTVAMTYASFNRGSGASGFGIGWKTDAIDEIRKLTDGVYVGAATSKLDSLHEPARRSMLAIYESYGLELRDRYQPTDRTPPLPTMFVLTGPAEPWVGVDDPQAEDQ